jgi:hypothetical protein
MNIDKITEAIKVEYERELKEVAKNHPLIFTDLMLQGNGSLTVAARTEKFAKKVIDPDVAIAVGFRLSQCFNNFYRDLGRAGTDADVKAAFESFSSCWTRR